MDRQVRADGQASAETTAPCPANVSLTGLTARCALFIGVAVAAMSLPVNIADNSGWFTLNSAFADHDNSNDSGPGHDGQGGGNSGGGAGDGGGGNSGGSGVGGGGGNSGGSGVGGGGSSGGSGTGGAGGGGNSGGNNAGGGQNTGDGAERDQQEAQVESFVESGSKDGAAADVAGLTDARAPGGDHAVPTVTQIIGAAGVTTLNADEELALIAAGWK